MKKTFILFKSSRARIFSRKYLTGFTLIELLVVIVIIAAMAVFAIPAFSTYGAKIDFVQKMDQVQELINKALTQSQNPAQGYNGAGVTVYKLVYYPSSKNITFDLTDLNVTYSSTGAPISGFYGFNPVHTLTLPDYYTLTFLAGYPDHLVDSLFCGKYFSSCCIFISADPTGTCYSASNGWFAIKDSKTGQTATFKKTDNPSRVTYQIQ
jgi:prepilin-type N-terminal cleavage/methylation domain-containing protein